MIRRVSLFAGVLGVVAVFGSSAEAAPVTVGSPLKTALTGYFGGLATEANVALSEPGAHEVSPVTGIIVRYRVDVETLGQFSIRVLRPAASGRYTGAGTSTPVTPSVKGIQTFSSSLPIRAGDLIGLDLDANAGVGQANVAGSIIDEWGNPGLLLDGATHPPNTVYSNEELLFNGDVELDCDNDGLGDETQDSSLSGPNCGQPAIPQPAGTPHKKKKCKKHKKKHKRSAESAKKKKCGKKKKHH